MKQQKTNYTICYTGKEKVKRNHKQFLGYLEFRENYFSDYRRDHDNWFYLTQDEISNETDICRKTVSTYIKELSLKGMIEYEGGHKGQASFYRLKYDHREANLHAMSDEMRQKIQSESMCKNDEKVCVKTMCKNQKNMESETMCKNLCNYPDNQYGTMCKSMCKNDEKTEKITHKNKECRIKNENEEERMKKENESVKTKKFYEFDAVQDLKKFIISFLDSCSREEGKALYRDYTLQDEDMEFLTAFTSKVAELKGWKKTTKNDNTSRVEKTETTETTTSNTSSSEEESIYTATTSTSSFRTPSEIAFLDGFDDETEETPTVKNKAENAAISSVESDNVEAQLNKAIDDFKAVRKDCFNRWYKVLELQGEATADKNMEAFVLGGAVEDRFNKYEFYKKGIVQQQKTEVVQGWQRYKDSIRKKNEEKIDNQFFKDVEEIAKAYRWWSLDSTNKEKVFYTEIQPLVLNKYYSTCTREVQQTKANDAVQLMDKMAS